MYAIIAHSGKQYHVKPGLKFNVEKIPEAVGDEVKLEHVLMMYDGKNISFGTPELDGKAVLVRVIEHGLGDKVKIIKFKRRKHHLKRQGHRQAFTRLEVLAIGDKKTVKAPVVAKKSAEKAPAEKKSASTKSAKTQADDKKSPAQTKSGEGAKSAPVKKAGTTKKSAS